MASALPSTLVSFDSWGWWVAVWIYFVYVVLGGVNHELHRHVYTGEWITGFPALLRNLKRGQFVTFAKDVYEEFFFPAFLRYHWTYRAHVLGAGIWLLAGAHNLRAPPPLRAAASQGHHLRLAHRLFGYIYLTAGFLKGITVIPMSYYSHSLEPKVRLPLSLIGVWDCGSLLLAFWHIRHRRVAAHRRWMIRNFAVGAGSIWVRIFGAAWAACDLSFMRSPRQYGIMNGTILVPGFVMGILHGELWLAKSANARRFWWLAIVMLWTQVTLAARRSYYNKPGQASENDHAAGKKLQSAPKISGCPAAPFLAAAAPQLHPA